MQNIEWLGRTKLIVGDEGLSKLNNANVLVVGMGGVGSFAAEAIVRAGVGNLTIVDGDVVDPTNRNRQLPALATNHGQYKVDIMQERLMQINPELNLTVYKEFLRIQRVKEIVLEKRYDYVVDAIDSITPKVTLISTCHSYGIKLISSMGAGARMDPTRIKVTDISKTYNCVLAQYVRKRLKKYKIYKGVNTVFSTEPVYKKSLMLTDGTNFKKSAYGTISYLPAVFGCTCASVVIRGIVDWKEQAD